MNRLTIVALFIILVQGCASIGHKEFYSQIAPVKYPPTEKIMVFEYSNVELEEIYNILFSDYLIIGKSSFNGPYEKPAKALAFAKSIGADVFITNSQFVETRTSFMNITTPNTSTTYINGYAGGSYYSGTATTYGTQTTTVPIRIDRYDQDGMYLKNINNIIPIWEKDESFFPKTESSPMDGAWFNESYSLKLYKSGNYYVAFILNKSKDRKEWKIGELKLIYDIKTGIGIYLMGDKTPMIAKFKLNKFGNMEINITTEDEIISFGR